MSEKTLNTENKYLTPMEMISSAIQSGASIDIMRGLFDLQKEWEANEARKAFYKDFSLFKENVPKILKNKDVSFTNRSGIKTEYRHATLDKMLDTLCVELSKYNLSVSWKTENLQPIQMTSDNKTVLVDRVKVTCVLSHSLGHTESTSLEGSSDLSGGKNSIQAIGSTTSYLERYTLKAILGISESGDDTDGLLPPEKVSEEQAKEIINLLQSTNSNIQAFFKMFDIQDVKNMTVDKYKIAIQWLNSKKQAVKNATTK